MTQESNNIIRHEINDLRDDVTEVKVVAARIEQTTNESNRRLGEIEHAIKNFRMVAERVAIHEVKIKSIEEDIENLEKSKVDAKTFEALSKKIDNYEKRFIAVIVAGGGPLLAFIGTKLGVSLTWITAFFQ